MTNVDLIKKEGIRICRRIPRQVRSELNQAVKDGTSPADRFCINNHRPSEIQTATQRKKNEIRNQNSFSRVSHHYRGL